MYVQEGKEALLAFYPSYLETLEAVRERRTSLSKFYYLFSTGLIVGLGWVAGASGFPPGVKDWALFIAALFGSAMSVMWTLHLRGARRLYMVKVETLCELEASIGLKLVAREQEMLRYGSDAGAGFSHVAALQRSEYGQALIFLAIWVTIGICGLGGFFRFWL
jgi:hypothetical protein